jgi:hypothetical protein
VETDLDGRIARLRLSEHKPLYPLFEAVSNSLQSLEV